MIRSAMHVAFTN